jgi:hypothetical protein
MANLSPGDGFAPVVEQKHSRQGQPDRLGDRLSAMRYLRTLSSPVEQ